MKPNTLFKSFIVVAAGSCLFYCYLASREIYFTYHYYIDPLSYVSLAIFISAIFTFFVSIATFRWWGICSLLWWTLGVILIINAHHTSGKFFDVLILTKESISIWMGALFVIISLIMFAVMTWRENRAKKQREK